MGKTSRIQDWAENERPRERLLEKGVSSLTNTELIAIILRNGTHEKNVKELARELLAEHNDQLYERVRASLEKMTRINRIS